MSSRQARIALSVWLGSTLIAASAAAQSLSDSVESVSVNIALETSNRDEENQRYTINLGDCRDLVDDSDQEIEFTWTFDSDPPDGQYTIKVQDDDETCATSSLTEEGSDLCATQVLQASLPNTTTITQRLTFAELTGVTSEAACESNTSFHDVVLIFTSFTSEGSGSDDTDFDEVRIQFETTRPAAPTGVEATGGESSIEVDWAEVDDADSYDVFYTTDTLTQGDLPEDIVATIENTSSDSVTLDDGVERNLTYYVAVSTVDEDGNASVLSEVVTATTQPVTDFYELYRQSGGAETGCCSTSTGTASMGWLLGLGAAVLLWARRRRPESGR